MANRRFIDFPIASTVGDSDIILIWQSGANKQTTKATFLSGLPENLDELNDVAISGLTNGQILRYDSVTGKWENTDQGNLDLNDLNDVSIVSPSNGQVLVYNSSTSKWENSSGGYVPYTGAVTTVNLGAQTIQAGQFVKAGGTAAQFLKADGSVDSTAYGTGSVTSVALTMPSAFNVANSPITTAGTLAVTGAGTVGQYIRGDGSLADFPQASGGGSSVNYYLNGSISQGTIGGVAYKELNKVPILGAGTDFTINADGYIASFLTDAGDPNLLEIPGGNWNFETYFSASSSGGTPTFYVELYKYDGTTFTLIASSSTSPELIAFGTNLNPYFSTLAVPTTTLALTDRLAVRYYVTHSGRTITLHTENNHLCQIVTTFTTGLTSLNGLTAQVQNLAVGTSGTDFNIASATATHTFNLPTASATNRGALSSADWTTFNNKQNALGYVPVPETRTITINGVSQDLSANRTYNVGTVTSVGLSSATSGVTIGSTPVTTSGTITLAIATASGSQNGLLSSTDWTTFNNKQNALTLTTTGTSGAATLVGATLNIPQYQAALTNPVTGTGTTNYLPKFTGSTTIGNSIIQDAGTRIDVAGVLRLTQSSTTDIQAYTGSAYSNLFYDAASHNWQTSGGTAKMTLTSGGNLLVGTTTDNGARLQVEHNGNSPLLISTSSTTLFTTYRSNSVVVGYIGNGDGIVSSGGATNFGIRAENDLIFTSGGNNRRMTITSSGNVVIGTTSPSVALEISGASNLASRIRAVKTGSGTIEIGADRDTFGSPYISAITNSNLDFFTNDTYRLRITSGGNVLIGTTNDSPSAGIGIKNYADGRIYCVSSSTANTTESYSMYSTGAANYRFYVGWGGTIYATSTSISGISDISLKTNIRDLDKGLQDILQLKPRKFDWKNGDGKDNIGFVAQEIESIFPELISEYKYNEFETKKSLKMGDLIPSLVKAIQELKQEIDTLKN